MASLFSGLNNARTGLMASQTALNVAAQNISNASTPGYTRQTLNLLSVGPDTGSYRFARIQPNVGYGVNYRNITQSRDPFLDVRYRDANSEHSDWQTQSDAMSQIEDIFNEFTNSSKNTLMGLSGKLSDLLTDLQKYQDNPMDVSMATTVRSDVDTILFTVRTEYFNLEKFEAQQKSDLSVIIDGNKTGGGINAILGDIASLNKQIAGYEVSGQKANDLRDQRNALLDTLSGYLDIDVTEQSNGMVTVGLKSDRQHMLIGIDNSVTGLQLNSGKNAVYWNDGDPDGASPPASKATIGGGSVDAYLQVINGDGSSSGQYGSKGIVYFKEKLNIFAASFAEILNNFDTQNVSSTSAPLVTLDPANAAASIAVSEQWRNDAGVFISNYTGTSMGNYVGELMNKLNESGTVSLGGSPAVYFDGSILDFADSFTSDIATTVKRVADMADFTASIVENIDAQRMSISSVSIDEEGINIVKFHQSYNAAARVITAIDEMLDKLINGTGIVGT